MPDNISIGNTEVIINRKKVKNLSIRVLPPEGLVKLTVPLRMKEEEALSFVRSKEAWIRKQQQKLKGIVFNRPLTYSDGEIHYLFGKEYVMRIIESQGREGVNIKDNILRLSVKTNSSTEERERLMENWYRQNLGTNVPELIRKWEPVMKVKVKEFRIRKMKTRWGTCNISKKRIWLSLMLAKRRPALVEYIVVHEMVHLLEAGHNKRFYSLMDHFLPQWKELRKELR
ncbi:MAG: SprT family zinc-dependent metalloprotease [Marinilabiliaceae bacterium]|jgi:predicted metal-dependent hydrolase|nr:SprT family zinc-dependent metalloprotease [Marinilabiliaceae bacterium]